MQTPAIVMLLLANFWTIIDICPKEAIAKTESFHSAEANI